MSGDFQERQVVLNTTPVSLIACSRCSLTIFAIGENGLCDPCQMIIEDERESIRQDLTRFIHHGNQEAAITRLTSMRIGEAFNTEAGSRIERKTASRWRVRGPGDQWWSGMMGVERTAGYLG